MIVRKIIAITRQSLDGIMQAPGGPAEDPQGGFTHGGWSMIFDDDLVHQHVDNFIGKAFAKAGKYVVTRGSKPLPWKGSVRLG